jgi:hypothetical protein
MEDWEEETWDNIKIPDLHVSMENRERERRLIEQRKLVEDSDAELAEALFSNDPKEIKVQPTLCNIKPIPTAKREKPKDLLEKRQKELREKQINEEKKDERTKGTQKALKETYGEAEADLYDDMYGDIADKY